MGRTRFVPARGLDAKVARAVALPGVRRLLAAAEAEARSRAPAAKTWQTEMDDRVRPAHAGAQGQSVPENVAFLVGGTVMRDPKDENAPADLVVNCRCHAPRDPQAVARSISVRQPRVAGARVSGRVICDFPHAAESEKGSELYPPAFFMGGALRSVARRTRRAGRTLPR